VLLGPLPSFRRACRPIALRLIRWSTMLSQRRITIPPESSQVTGAERPDGVAHGRPTRRASLLASEAAHPVAVQLSRITAWPAPWAVAFCLLLLLLVVAADVKTGSEIEFSLFYFLPIIFASIRFEISGGLTVALVSAVLARFPVPHVPVSVTIANMLTEAITFSSAAIVTGALQRQGQRLRAQRRELRETQRWLEADLQAAELLQDHLLRRPLPEVPGLAAAVELVFARGVGGDFYDLRRVDRAGTPPRLSRPCLAVCVADVSGKGAKAALISAALRALLDEAGGKPADPGAFLQHLNARLSEALPDEMFVTMFYGCLDVETGTLEYASAGHDPPLLCRGETVEELLPTAPALGITSNIPARTERVTMQPGETLLVYTDGLTTARHALGGRVGEERVVGWLRERAALPPAELVHEILSLACPPSESPLEDDVAIIALRRRAG
jgi:serine phosphatase RsbU (regulator of sigma subunit)